MRETKFRGKRVDNGEWVYGYYAQDIDYIGPKTFKCTDCIISAKKDNSEGNWFEVGSETIGQFTGLKDKVGREIYEGDVVYQAFDVGDGCDPRGIRHSTVILDSWQNTVSFMFENDVVGAILDREIIGNIHEATP